MTHSAGVGSAAALTAVEGASRSPVAVVGLGAVTAFGWSVEALRVGLRSGRTTVAEPQRLSVDGHRTRLASEVSDTPSRAHRSDSASRDGTEPRSDAPDVRDRGLTRADQFAVVAAREAWDEAFPSQVAEPRRSRVGVFFGGSTAGMAEAEEFLASLLAEDMQRRTGLRSLASQQLNGPGDAVARDLGVRGPVVSFSSACASGALAVGAALDALRCGEIDVAVAGGSDGLCQMTYAGFNALRAVDPELSRPFRADRAGLNLGEGAGVLILETCEHAAARGARVHALLRGAGASCDAHHMTAPHPEGRGAAQSMTAALDDGGLAPGAVAFVNAHGTGTPHNDVAEAAAIGQVLGDRKGLGDREGFVPVTSIKGAIGHLLGAAGAVEAVATVLALIDGAVQPTSGERSQAGADPDFAIDLVVGDPRAIEPRGAGLSNSFAFGGANATLVFTGASAENTPGAAENQSSRPQ